jgi:hypothetical protein
MLSERQYGELNLIKLDNNITLVCTSCPNLKNQTIRVLGTVQKYLNQSEIEVLRILNSSSPHSP